MRLFSLGADEAPITRFDSCAAFAHKLGSGQGATHVNAVRFAPGGEIGPHRAGFDQLFVVIEGSGWVAGADGERHTVAAGEGAVIRQGEIHAKGSAGGARAIMIQVTELDMP